VLPKTQSYPPPQQDFVAMVNLPAIACEESIRETDSTVGKHKIQGRFWFP
jgi:hypothetical protein